jgi:hypothetical protein
MGALATVAVVMEPSVKVALIVGTPVMCGVIATFVMGVLTRKDAKEAREEARRDAKEAREEARKVAEESRAKLLKIGEGVDGLASGREKKIDEQGAQLIIAEKELSHSEGRREGSESEREKGK